VSCGSTWTGAEIETITGVLGGGTVSPAAGSAAGRRINNDPTAAPTSTDLVPNPRAATNIACMIVPPRTPRD
jgi:hypothetical protein